MPVPPLSGALASVASASLGGLLVRRLGAVLSPVAPFSAIPALPTIPQMILLFFSWCLYWSPQTALDSRNGILFGPELPNRSISGIEIPAKEVMCERIQTRDQ